MRSLRLVVLITAFASGAALAHGGTGPGFQFEPVVLGQVVLTDGPSAPAPNQSLLAQLAANFLTPTGVMTALGFILSIIGGATWMSSRRKRIIANLAFHAYHIVEDLDEDATDGKNAPLNKTVEYLKALNTLLLQNGWRPLKPGEEELAKSLASSMHGQNAVAADLAAAGAPAPAVKNP